MPFLRHRKSGNELSCHPNTATPDGGPGASSSADLNSQQLAQLAQCLGTNGFRNHEKGFAAHVFKRLSAMKPAVPTVIAHQVYEPPSTKSALRSLAFQPSMLAIALPGPMTSCQRISFTDEPGPSLPLNSISEDAGPEDSVIAGSAKAPQSFSVTASRTQPRLKRFAAGIFSHHNKNNTNGKM